MSEAEDPWSAYAKGVRRLGEKQELGPPEKPVNPPAASSRAPFPPSWTEGVTAFKEKQASTAQGQNLVQEDLAPTPPAPPQSQEPPLPRAPLDIRIERNLSLGDVVIEARLDLHGKTEQAAYGSFSSFIEANAAKGRRLLLIVTGRGKDGESVLRKNLPRWCDVPPFSAHILAVRLAAPHHGGDGAYYVLLRKRAG